MTTHIEVEKVYKISSTMPVAMSNFSMHRQGDAPQMKRIISSAGTNKRRG